MVQAPKAFANQTLNLCAEFYAIFIAASYKDREDGSATFYGSLCQVRPQCFAVYIALAIETTKMNLGDRIFHAAFGAFFGALIGAVCWWLYGLAHSLNYSGPDMEPVLRHWIVWTSTALAVTGFVLRHGVADAVGDIVSGIFHFETDDTSSRGLRTLASLVCLAIIIAAIWHTAPR